MIDVILNENDGYQRRYRLFSLEINLDNQFVYPLDHAIEKAGSLKLNQNNMTPPE